MITEVPKTKNESESVENLSAQELVSRINPSLRGIGVAGRPHLLGDNKHQEEVMRAAGRALHLANLGRKWERDFLNIQQNANGDNGEKQAEVFEQYSQEYNEILVTLVKEAIQKEDTVLYFADYIAVSGKNLGRQVVIEFTSNLGKRLYIAWNLKELNEKYEDGQILGAYVIHPPGTKIGNYTVQDPPKRFKNRKWVLGDEDIWLSHHYKDKEDEEKNTV